MSESVSRLRQELWRRYRALARTLRALPPDAPMVQGSLYRLQASGGWAQVALSTTMRSGEATWVLMKGRTEFTGPLQILLESSNGLDFGRTLQDQTLRIRNVSATATPFYWNSSTKQILQRNSSRRYKDQIQHFQP